MNKELGKMSFLLTMMLCATSCGIFSVTYAKDRNDLSKYDDWTDEEIDALYEKLQPLTKVNEEEKFQHVQNIRENTEPVKLSEFKANPNKVRCPSCGSRLVIRKAKRGKYAGSRFLGCPNYPRCRYTRDVVDDI